MSHLTSTRAGITGLGIVLSLQLVVQTFSSAWAVTTGWSDPVLVDPLGGDLNAASCAPDGFCVAVDDFGYAITRVDGEWQRRIKVDRLDALVDVSCVSSRFCMAIDHTSAIRYSDGRWQQRPTPLGDPLAVVSCPTETFCMAADENKHVYFYDGHRWSSPVEAGVAGDENSLDCVSKTFCMMADDHLWSVYDGHTFSPARSFEGPFLVIESVTCRNAHFCLATDWAGDVLRWHSDHWGPRHHVFPSKSPTASCARHGLLCAMVGSNGQAMTYEGNGWSRPVGIGDHAFLPDVSCASASSCVAIDLYQKALTFDGSRWTATNIDNLQGRPTGISCAADGFCSAVDESGSALIRDKGAWSAPTSVTWKGLAAISCTERTFCMAIGLGYAYRFDGVSWGTGTLIHPGTRLSSVSCVTSSFCVAVDRGGYANIYNGSAWSRPEKFANYNSDGMSVSCVSTTFCVAVNPRGRAFTFDGTHWSDPVQIRDPGLGNDVTYVSCGAVGDCVAVAAHEAIELNGGNWSSPETIDPPAKLSGVSCATPTSCTATDNSGAVLSFDGLTWTSRLKVDPHRSLTGISCIKGACAAVDRSGHALVQTEAG
jgi:hypothetical protein